MKYKLKQIGDKFVAYKLDENTKKYDIMRFSDRVNSFIDTTQAARYIKRNFEYTKKKTVMYLNFE